MNSEVFRKLVWILLLIAVVCVVVRSILIAHVLASAATMAGFVNWPYYIIDDMFPELHRLAIVSTAAGTFAWWRNILISSKPWQARLGYCLLVALATITGISFVISNQAF